jgi:hypothetical protein
MSTTTTIDYDARHAAADFGIPEQGTGALLIAAAVFALAVASADLLSYQVNLPILYIVPLLLVERAGRRRVLWQSALLLVALTFAGFFLGRHPSGVDPLDLRAVPRLANRGMAAVMLVAAAGVLHAGIAMRERARRARHLWPHDPDGLSYQLAVLDIERVLAPVLAALLVIALFVSDAAAQAEYNVAVLYALPLVILARTRSAPLLWFGLPILLAATMLGLWVGPAPSPNHVWNLTLNRVLVCVAMVTVAVLLNGRLRVNRTGSP